MVGQPEQSVFDPLVYEWEVTDPVQGGAGGVANTPLLSLANRTRWLYDQLNLLRNGQLLPPNVAPLNGPAFTGSATSPNVAPGDNSQLIANTNFVQTAIGGIAVVSVGGNANVTLSQPQWGVGILVFTGVLTGAVRVIFPNRTGAWIVANNTTGAFSLTCGTSSGGGVIVPQDMPYAGVWCDGSAIFRQNSLYNLSPGTFTAATVTVATDGHITSIAQGSPAGRLLGVQVFATPGTFVYAPSVDTTAVIVEVQGAGGAGGGSLINTTNGTSIGGPGTSGAYGKSRYTAAFAGVTITVGTGGASHQGGAGSNGGASSFGTLLTCPGGSGGGISSALTTIVAGGNGNQVFPTGANIMACGSDAGGISQSVDANASFGAFGGRSMFGGGSPGASVNAFANNALSPGSGGAGTANFNNGTFASIGGKGANGIVLVYEYA